MSLLSEGEGEGEGQIGIWLEEPVCTGLDDLCMHIYIYIYQCLKVPTAACLFVVMSWGCFAAS